jgi:hypothetical protein
MSHDPDVYESGGVEAVTAQATGRNEDSAAFSIITSSAPAELSKVFELRDAKLHKTVSANVTRGSIDVMYCTDLKAFAQVLGELKRNQCLVYGLPTRHPAKLVTDEVWHKAGCPPAAVSRTEKNFSWSRTQPGILMLDHDPQPGMPAYSPPDLLELVRRAVPELADVDVLTWPSASSLIFHGESGEMLSPMKGCRLYIIVDEAATIPAWGRYIVDALWAAGHGVYVPSRSGQLLERGLFDTTVWQASRIDFAAGAACRPPLEQRRGQPMLHPGTSRSLRNGTQSPVSSSGAALTPTLSDAQVAAAALTKGRARAAVAVAAAAAAESYAKQRLAELEAAGVKTGQTPEVARVRARVALQAMLQRARPELSGTASIQVVRDDVIEEVTVAEILRHKKDFDGAKTLDPLEPEYDNGRAVGKLFLNGATPSLHSFARGGATYKLVAQLGNVELMAGAMDQGVDQTLACLADSGDLYDHGDVLATVSAEGELVPVTKGLVSYYLSSRISFFKNMYDRKTDTWKRVAADPPPMVCTSVYELGEQRRLPRLEAVVTAPIVVNGRLLTKAGYDAPSGLALAIPEGLTPIEARPDLAAVRAAFARLHARFGTFPFDTPADRGVLMAAILTAVMRPGLRTAPGFAFDAPAQGTGKSLLADCIAIIGTGTAPSALPHLYDDESEVRKRLVSLLHSGSPVMIWDNIKGTFDSAVLASLLTAATFNDRLLGETKVLKLPNRLLAIFNGNNMMLRGELTRRILPCRLDARMERPYLRQFSENPRDTCTRERQDIVRDALTIILGYQTHGGDQLSKVTLGSFEEWSAAVLQPLLWAIGAFGSGHVASPLSKLQQAEDDDEELNALTALHHAWHDMFGDKPQTIRQIIDTCFKASGFDSDEPCARLDNAITDYLACAANRGHENRAVALGRNLNFRVGRVFGVNRMFLKSDKRASGGVVQWIAHIDEDGALR